MSPEFDYHQRPFTRRLTDEEYNRAVGRLSSPSDHGNATNAPVSTCNHGLTIREQASRVPANTKYKPYHPDGPCAVSTCGACK